jgi:hypothetical protein
VKKADISASFADGGIINHRIQHNSLCTDKNKHYVTYYMKVYKAMNHVALTSMGELSFAPTLVV